MDDIEPLRARVAELWDMHQQLAARVMALSSVCRVMLPLVPADHALLQRLAASSCDALNTQLTADGMHADLQVCVRAAHDQVWAEILQVSALRDRPKASG